MTILKRSKRLILTCPYCGCKFAARVSDIRYICDDESGKFRCRIRCPECGAYIRCNKFGALDPTYRIRSDNNDAV